MLSDLHPPFNRRPPKDAPLRSRKPVAIGPLLPSDRQAELAALEEVSALCALGWEDVQKFHVGRGEYFITFEHADGRGGGACWIVGVSDEELLP